MHCDIVTWLSALFGLQAWSGVQLVFSCDLAQLWCQSTHFFGLSVVGLFSPRSRGIWMAGVGSRLAMEEPHLRTLRIMFPGG